MIYVSHMGGLWRMRKLVFASFLKAIAEGKGAIPNPDDYGVFVGNPVHVTDMPPSEAQDRLDKLQGK